eukprot:TRINITY_DN68074_c6_g5_i1.p2 TRINITY_DN68074_c6_g5~~TRINITY_DN68074_c6_g5_i1.p2  ORF type:complete len:615 (-),score=71.17 TRINITY_DN68074_c6_g5_i1:3339-5183(-)
MGCGSSASGKAESNPPQNAKQTGKTIAVTGQVTTSNGVKEPPGLYDDGNPLFEFLGFIRKTLEWVEKKRKENGGAVIFRASPGLRAVVCTDNATFHFMTSAPPDTINRENALQFGPAGLPLAGTSQPVAVSRDQAHDVRRKLFIEVFHYRGMDQLWEAIKCAVEDVVPRWKRRGNVLWSNGMKQLAYYIGFQWTFGTRPSWDDFRVGADNALGLVSDYWLASLIGKLRDKSDDADVQASVKRMTALMAHSPVWPHLLAKAKEFGVPESDLELDFWNTIMINAIGPLFLVFTAVLPFLTKHPQITEKLRQELAGKDITPETVKDVEKFPYLDAVVHEFQRAAPQPVICWRWAEKDFEMPTSTGDKYQIRKDERLVCPVLACMHDEVVFGKDYASVRPERFIENPSLKEKVVFFFRSPNKKNTYDCAAATGPNWAMTTYKLVVAAFADQVQLTFNEEPQWDSAMSVQDKLKIKTAEFREKPAGTYPTSGKSKQGRLSVTVLNGERIAKSDRLSKSDPYVELITYDSKVHSSVQKNTDTPTWNETLVVRPYVFDNKVADVLFVRVLDKDLLGSDELGTGQVPLSDMKPGDSKDATITLDELGGTVSLRLTLDSLDGE